VLRLLLYLLLYLVPACRINTGMCGFKYRKFLCMYLCHVTGESSNKDFINSGNVALYKVLNHKPLFLYISPTVSTPHNLYLNSSFFLSVTSANSISVLCPTPLSLALLSLLLFSH
jgi:hypothetical protein